MDFSVTIAEQLFVHHCQQGILDGRSCFPDFIQEYHICHWQVSINASFILVWILQFADTHRTKDFIWRRESRHQILERPAFVECSLYPSSNHRLRHTWRSQQNETFSCDSSQQRHRQFCFLFINAFCHFFQEALYSIFHRFSVSIFFCKVTPLFLKLPDEQFPVNLRRNDTSSFLFSFQSRSSWLFYAS